MERGTMESDLAILADRFPGNPDPRKWPVNHAGRPMNPVQVARRQQQVRLQLEWIERIRRMLGR